MMVYLLFLISVNPVEKLKDKAHNIDYYRTTLDEECVRIVFVEKDLFNYFESNGYTYSRSQLWAGTEKETLQHIIDEKLDVEKIKDKDTKDKVKEKLENLEKELKIERL